MQIILTETQIKTNQTELKTKQKGCIVADQIIDTNGSDLHNATYNIVLNKHQMKSLTSQRLYLLKRN